MEEDDSLSEFSAEDLELGNKIYALALMGLGQCEILMKDLDEGRKCFAFFNDEAVVGNALRLEAYVRHGRTLIVAKQFTTAVTYLQEVFGQKVLAHDQHLGLCIRMVMAGMAHGETAGAEKMIHAGLRGIAGLGRYDMVQFLVDKHGINLNQLGGFYFSWIKGAYVVGRGGKEKDAGSLPVSCRNVSTCFAGSCC